MERLKLVALDEVDLEVVSACLQDAVFKVADLAYAGNVFTLEANRFVWEAGARAREWQRRRAVLAVKRVTAVRSRGIDRDKADEVHSLLALRFAEAGQAPQGVIELVLAGGGSIHLEVECIEAQLGDVSGSWGTEFKPRHQLG